MEQHVRSSTLIRFSGDISTKARKTRLRFTRRLVANLEDALASEGIPNRVERAWAHLYLEGEDPRVREVLPRVFGIQTFSPVLVRPWRGMGDILEAGEEIFSPLVVGKRFAVRAKRRGDRKRIPFDSGDVERELGTRLLPHATGVDLDHPEVTAYVEVDERQAYFFQEKIQGRGGLPVGVEGRALALISGGFDSAVASWLLLKRGVALDYVFFNLGGIAHELGALKVVKVLADRWSYGTRPKFHSVNFQPVVAELQTQAEPRYWQVLLKRLMVRGAATVTRELGVPALITGEAVGQVSSQTLQNLAVISQTTTLPLLRPLLGFNKEEILGYAREIGIYELAAAVGEYCAIVPRRPATRASRAAVEREEGKLDLGLVERAVAERRILDLRPLDVDQFAPATLEIDHLPPEATVVDLRSRAAYQAWHYPGAVQLDFPQALRAYRSFDQGRTYVLYCEVGLKSAHLAERMQEAGFRAYNFRGGVRRLLAYAREREGLDPRLLAPALLTEEAD